MKEKLGTVQMIVDEDIPMSDISKLAGKILVGKFSEKSSGKKSLVG